MINSFKDCINVCNDLGISYFFQDGDIYEEITILSSCGNISIKDYGKKYSATGIFSSMKAELESLVNFNTIVLQYIYGKIDASHYNDVFDADICVVKIA